MAFFTIYNSDMFVHPYSIYYNIQDNIFRPRLPRIGITSPYFRPSIRSQLADDSPSSSNNRKFEMRFDVGDFTAEEIKVSLAREDGKNIVHVTANRQSNDSGEISEGSSSGETSEGPSSTQPAKEFSEKRTVPRECDVNKIQSELATDGILTVSISIDPSRVHRNIPILQTGEPQRRRAVQSVSARAG